MIERQQVRFVCLVSRASDHAPSRSGRVAIRKALGDLAKQNTPTRVIGLKLGRTPGAVQSQASKQGTSLKPTNQSPYNRRKK